MSCCHDIKTKDNFPLSCLKKVKRLVQGDYTLFKIGSLLELKGAQDLGGPRKEFFRLVLKDNKEQLFDNGLRELLPEKYYTVGKMIGVYSQN